ncbi:hypothetical protein [Thalassobius sp. Cn5-15]|uniref:hypothetical protein n=1 Tax=Thalassobius sp. Cn5-15 TaxID=2917763 RepID=UPI001EF3BE4C|nr:hypothetical protein [Thalassobius sp. Cn5-15]
MRALTAEPALFVALTLRGNKNLLMSANICCFWREGQGSAIAAGGQDQEAVHQKRAQKKAPGKLSSPELTRFAYPIQ